MKRHFCKVIIAVLTLTLVSSCSTSQTTPPSAVTSAGAPGSYSPYASAAAAPTQAPGSAKTPYNIAPYNSEEYDTLKENDFKTVADAPISTFSADVDTASYCNVRRMLKSGTTLSAIPEGAARTEEMLNYFKYDYDQPTGKTPFGITASVSDCPWNAANKLLVLGVTTKSVDYAEIGGCNYVFLIDTSGSMGSRDKLGLLQDSLLNLLNNLSDKDRISIVTYAGTSAVLARGVYGDDRSQLKELIASLSAGGSTNGSAGIEEAYRLAEKYYIPNGVNRIIMCSDGDLNVGITNQSDLYKLVSEKRKSGVFLSVLGFGTGNYSDSRMQTLADNGNGNYYYIDSILEAKKVLCDELVSTMVTVAKDVKFQIEFNPFYLTGYRQLGYENRQLSTQDFTNDKIDAGDVGSGCCLTVVYELIPQGSQDIQSNTALKYQSASLTSASASEELMTVKIRYKEPSSNDSELLSTVITRDNITNAPSSDWKFATAVCEFGMLIHKSTFKGNTSLASITEILDSLDLSRDTSKLEFQSLIKALNR